MKLVLPSSASGTPEPPEPSPAKAASKTGVCVWPEYPLSAKELIGIDVVLLVNLQVLLRRLDLSEESVLEHVDLIGVHGQPLMDGVAAVVADLQYPSPGHLALDAEVPRLRVGLGNVRIQAIDVVSEICQGLECGIRFRIGGRVGGRIVGVWRQRLAHGKRTRSERSGFSGVVRIKVEVLVIERGLVGGLVPEILLRFGEAAERITGANDGLAAAGQLSGDAILGTGRRGDADGRLRADVPGLVLMRAGHELRISVAAQNAGREEIANRRRTVDRRRQRARVFVGQIVVVAGEVPAQAVVNGQIRTQAVGILRE